jgi:hypothetical protein
MLKIFGNRKLGQLDLPPLYPGHCELEFSTFEWMKEEDP